MRKLSLLPAIVLVFFFVLARGAYAGGTPLTQRDQVYETKLHDQLRGIAPGAVSLFEAATRAYDSRDYTKAAELYEQVAAQAPAFSAAKRRQCGALAELGRRELALPLCREALAEEDSPENKAGLAAALALHGTPPQRELGEAIDLAEHAAEEKPAEAQSWALLCQIAIAAGEAPRLRLCSSKLDALAPEEPFTDICDVLVAVSEGDESAARRGIEHGKAHGLDATMLGKLQELVDKSIEGRPWWIGAGKAFLIAVAVWLLALGALLGVGYALSRGTLRAIAQHPTEATVRESERRLRTLYRSVLWIASAYYYVSLPLVALSVLVVVGGIIAAVLAAGYIAPKLFIILILLGFGSIFAIGKALFVRVKDEDPGEILDLGANPAFRGVLQEVAGRIGTRPVDRVYMTPFTEVAVFDRGGLGAQLRGGSDRCLILGAGVLDGMRVRSFKAVLAHEYGHFHNEDTAGGGFALSVRRSLMTMAMHLIARGAASPLNPAWWFVRGFWRAFLGVSQGASRLQEVLADRWAAFAYGSSAFEAGLRHVVERSVRFDAHMSATLDEVVKQKQPLPNLYAFAPASPHPAQDVDRAIAEAFGKKPTPYDSHPSPDDRIALVRALAAQTEGVAPAGADDDAEVWSLFADRKAIEARMTDEVRGRLAARRGIVVKAA